MARRGWGMLLLVGLGCRDAPAPHAPDAARAVEAAPREDATPAWRFLLEERVEPYETFVTVRPNDGERPALDWRPRSGSLRISLERGVPWREQAAQVGEMVAELDARRAPAWSETKVFAHMDLLSAPAFGARLAKHAQADAEWARVRDAVREPGGTRRLHDYVRRALREADLHPELDQMFAPIGRRPRLVSVEKCWSERPTADSEAGARLRTLGFEGRARLPGGCLMMWFELASTSTSAAGAE